MEYNEAAIVDFISAGIIFGVYLFIAISFFYFLSSPVDVLLSGIGDSSIGTASETNMISILPTLKTAVLMAFALGIAFPVTWFIFWVFSKEPDLSRIRYR